MMMSQNRVSPASSPMRRPSGSGSIGSASPMAERPQSVENPLTPRGNTGSSRPHTPSGPLNCPQMDQQQQHHIHQQQMNNPMDMQNFSPMDNCGMGNMGSPSSHKMHNFMQNPGDYQGQMMNNDYNNANVNNSGGGGGNPHVIPFPTFSFFDGPVKLGLKGGNPFSVVTEHTPSTSNSNVVEQTANTTVNQVPMPPQASASPANVAHPAGGSTPSITSSNIQQQVNNTSPPLANCQGERMEISSGSKSCGPLVAQQQQGSGGGEAKQNIEPLPTLQNSTPSTASAENDIPLSKPEIITNSIQPVNKTSEILATKESSGSRNTFPSNVLVNNDCSQSHKQGDGDQKLYNHVSEGSELVNHKENNSPSSVAVTKVDTPPLITENKNHVLPANYTTNITTTLTDEIDADKVTIVPKELTPNIPPINKKENVIPSDEIKHSPIANHDQPISLGGLLDRRNSSSSEGLPVETTSSFNHIALNHSTTVTTLDNTTLVECPDTKPPQAPPSEEDVHNSSSSQVAIENANMAPQPPVSAEESSPLMHSILAQPQRSVSVESNSSSQTMQDASPGEAQSTNALLKQLLQNTGCASTAQTSEFSLTSLTTKPPTSTVHTSHLSEAATRIPQPATLPKSASLSGPDSDNAIVKTEISEGVYKFIPHK